MWIHSHGQDPAHASSRGPAPPSAVAASGKKAFAALSASDASKMQFQQEHAASHAEDSPIVAPDTAILVRSESGQNLQIPIWGDDLEDEDSWSDSESFDRSSVSESNHAGTLRNSVATANPERRNKNLQWLRSHFQSLTEIGNLVFNNADLWQLHQYFFSPAYTISDDADSDQPSESVDTNDGAESQAKGATIPSSPASSPASFQQREKILSNGCVSSELASESADSGTERDTNPKNRSNKRGSLEEALKDAEPCAKRAKNFKPRIAYFPRIRVSFTAIDNLSFALSTLTFFLSLSKNWNLWVPNHRLRPCHFCAS